MYFDQKKYNNHILKFYIIFDIEYIIHNLIILLKILYNF
jgi:hypothetical protein